MSQLIDHKFFKMKVCSVADITGASGASNLGSIPSRPVANFSVELLQVYVIFIEKLRGLIPASFFVFLLMISISFVNIVEPLRVNFMKSF